MGNLRACLAVAVLALAACGSDHAKTDAAIVLIDSPTPDAKVWEDAPPGPSYDLSCLNDPAPDTADDPITVAGTTGTLSTSGLMAVPAVDVDVFEVGNETPLASVVSDSAGAFATDEIATGGTPINGYVRAMEPTYRSTYLYPGTVVSTSLTGVPVILVSNTLFGLVAGGAGITQNDDNNGALLVAVTDCSTGLMPIDGATVKVQQDGTDVGTVFDLGQLFSQAAGTFFVFNVPDGETQVLVSYNGMSFPPRTVHAYKKPMGQGAEGTISVVQVRPSN